ncbi:helix-turn-helix transcriptional regulator [Lysobacter sp. K5869]|uniref:AraC family transcriptional regulator n=1 Tax=Lysobacter sp. K5869 TaxID=2820808 RepID=UPI001C061189|nr:AraC family transcriptional regulator [Lysobacter sp. K5869]QWP75418.1 helix-turn-helix transcriptional regulator [Lysobacter sp. K5869]
MPPWTGTIRIAEEFALVHAVPGDARAHRHYCHQIVRAPRGTVSARIGERWLRESVLAIGSQCEHALQAGDAPCFMLFAEPMSFDLAELREAMTHAPAEPEALLRAAAACRRPHPVDPRVSECLQRIDGMLADKIPAASLAAGVQLSLSQLERLFGAQLNLSIRRLILWRRLRLAAAEALRERNLTLAAHAAGFTDSAHLSRAFRQFFGVRGVDLVRGMRLQA